MLSLFDLINLMKSPQLGIQGTTATEVIAAAEQFLGLQPVAGDSLHARALAICRVAGFRELFEGPPADVSVEEVAVEEVAPTKALPQKPVSDLFRANSILHEQQENKDRFSHPLLRHLGKPSSSFWLNLDTIDRALCGLPSARKGVGLDEIAAYSAFMDPAVRGKEHVEASRNVLHGEDATLMRHALLTTYLFVQHHMLRKADLHHLINLEHARDTLKQTRLRQALLRVRPLVFGTASGLTSAVKQRLSSFPMTRGCLLFLLNDMLRGYAQVFWCCNPWMGLGAFIALLIDDTWMALVCLVAVLSCNVTARVLGASPILLELGLLQCKCVVAARIIAYQNLDTPPQDTSWESMKIFKCLFLIVINCFWVNVLSIGLGGLLIPRIQMCEYGLGYQFGILTVLMWGAENSVFNNGVGIAGPVSDLVSTSLSGSAWDIDHIDWGKAADAVFRSSACCIWLSSTHASLLMWVGMLVTSPIFALLYFSGAWIAQLTFIVGGASTSVIYGGYWLWAPALNAGVIGGLVNVPSLQSMLYAWLSAVFTVLTGNLFARVCGLFGMPGFGISHPFVCVIFTMARYVKFATVPVDISNTTVPEDHLYQSKYASKCFLELAEIVCESTSDPNAPDLATRSLRFVLPESSVASIEASVKYLTPLRSVWRKVQDYVYLCFSWGAFSLSELLPMHEAQDGSALSCNKTISVMRRVAAALEKVHEQELDETPHDLAMQGWLLAVLLLSGECNLTVKDVERLKLWYADVHDHEVMDSDFTKLDPGLRREVTMVYMTLQLAHMADVAKHVSLFYELFDKDGDGHITEVELLVVLKKERPDDNTLESRIAEIVEEADRDASGGICANELLHTLLNCKAARKTRLNLLQHVTQLCQLNPTPHIDPNEIKDTRLEIEKIRHELNHSRLGLGLGLGL